ncbi:p10 [Orgyia pseudotsugata multiple nucleopolyhedrovirus]|uniref:Protein p10 n=1 Tax=Orgyia pseudotsugata multicapsid polyhedrosis virus TaxID=262177 RepID=VP10_NPVOP|nr:p10 [Orgyia pseudotsugata multiple nucleopolyhedrovirus]P08357.1 RecName: Full=Protein p10; AltName: Full=Fibrous body protein [Orgyia pseudotsugata multiple nucleopolyhedrovirus]pir/T10402/ protein p10 - Orgyia pseudotsugata nuclear polyhedrosis virus [Orgyia pseudotsugata single capsid nuclopolyhedrovirus]AAA46725.1 p10 protein [Orgyia pseudotsugata single capsid nuclopolyhedrovirus]AAC59132.1 p10 [Orgyia pseudotsugata multiple nucleopolyhedrovirus]
MSKPSILTQILDAVRAVDSKVTALQTQVDQLVEDSKTLEALTDQLGELDNKVSDIQSMLSVEEELPEPPAPAPEPELPEIPDVPGLRRSRKQ